MNRRARPVAVWIAVAGACASAAWSRPAVDVQSLDVRRSGPLAAGGGATFVTSRNGHPIPVDVPAGRNRLASLAFWDQYGSLFGVSDPVTQLALKRVETDTIGQVHTTYQQMHEGVQVFSGIVKVHQNAKGEVLAANGRFYPIKPGLAVVPGVDEQKAINAARAAIGEKCDPIVEASSVVIVDPGWYGDPATGARLAYFITLTDLNAGVREAFFVNAHTAEVMDQWTLIEQLTNRDVYDGGQAAPLPGTLARSEGQPAVPDIEVNRAYDYAGDFHAFFQRAFGRDGVDGSGGLMIQTVNSGSTGCPNAYWNGFQAVYCTGLCTDDIVAHELGHGLTQFTAGLMYQNQSGQLNESFSDVWGELVDLFNGDASVANLIGGGILWPNPPAVGAGTDSPNNLRSACSPRPAHPDGTRWLIGEDAAGFGGALRDMHSPACVNDPDRANSPLMLCEAIDAGGVHHGSGVPNKAFSLVVDGGTFNGRTVVGIGAIKAGAIWYRALTTYLTPASDFKDAYDALIQSATDLIGVDPNDPRTAMPSGSAITAFDVEQLTESLLATEMNTDGLCGQTANVLDEAPAVECADRNVVFSEDFETGAMGWTVANSAPPTPYDWVLTSTPLPHGRPGIAYFCEDRAVGDCMMTIESGTHTLTSPVIAIPTGVTRPVLAFTHLVASEGRYDGGLVEIKVDAGPWTAIPRTAFEFNGYNNRLYSSTIGSTNPLAGPTGTDAFSGVGGRWGRSIVNLAGFAVAGQNIELRWVFGKDACGGGGPDDGWYLDDVTVYTCPDCDGAGGADIDQLIYRRSTDTQLDIGWLSDRTVVLTNPPLAAGNVTIEAISAGDLQGSEEYIDLYVNNTRIDWFFRVAGLDCAGTPQRETLTVPASVWNAGAMNGSVTLLFTTTPFTQANVCGGTFLSASIRYPLGAPDINANLVLDACECPFVTDDPEALVVTAGDDAVFTAAASGAATLSYRWRRNTVELDDGPAAGGGTISGATTPTLTITDAEDADEGDYDVVVTNGCGTDTSAAASLTVNPVCAAIVTPPMPLTIDSGDDALFTVAASGSEPLMYQWRFNDVDLADGPSAGGGVISGATGAMLTITGAGFADEGPYRVRISNGCPEPALSDPVALTVDNPCPADFNESGVISVQDIFDFLEAYFAGDMQADFNQSMVLSVQDIFDFLEAYFTGCE